MKMNTLQLAQQVYNKLFYVHKIVECYERLDFEERCGTNENISMRISFKKELENYIKEFKKEV